MENMKQIRPCGGSFSYCDGVCATCSANVTYSTTTSSSDVDSTEVQYEDDFGCPTEQQYLESKKAANEFAAWLRTCRARQTELIDRLCSERESEKLYKENYEHHRDIVRRYEIYEEMKNNA